MLSLESFTGRSDFDQISPDMESVMTAPFAHFRLDSDDLSDQFINNEISTSVAPTPFKILKSTIIQKKSGQSCL